MDPGRKSPDGVSDAYYKVERQLRGAFPDAMKPQDVWGAPALRAVRERGKADHTHDLRYDLGAARVTVRAPNSLWGSRRPCAPISTRSGATGPLLERGVRRGRVLGRFSPVASEAAAR
jgi:hypothetical protein